MTSPVYGKANALQVQMLLLAGVVPEFPKNDSSVSDERRMLMMNKGYVNLKKQTREDFGFDIERWHEFLLSSDDYRDDYTFRYAWPFVLKHVQNALQDPSYQRLVVMLRNQPPVQNE